MPEKNTLEKLTFVRLYDADMNVCSLSRDKPGGLPGIARESSNVLAHFSASYCAENLILLVERKAYNSAFWSLDWLPERSLETISGLLITGAVDTIYEKAREWRDRVRALVERNAPDYIVAEQRADAPGIAERAMGAVADAINNGALDTDGMKATATVKSRRSKNA